jgi:hypothetical protein
MGRKIYAVARSRMRRVGNEQAVAGSGKTRSTYMSDHKKASDDVREDGVRMPLMNEEVRC